MAGVAIVNEQECGGGAGGSTVTWGFTPTAGNVLCVVGSKRAVNGSGYSIVTSGWTKRVEYNGGTGINGDSLWVWTKTSVGNESSITTDLTDANAAHFFIMELSGTTEAAFAASTVKIGPEFDTSIDTDAVSPIPGSGILFTYVTHQGSGGNFTAGSGWTQRWENVSGTHPETFLQSQAQTVFAGTYTGDCSNVSTNSWTSVIFSFSGATLVGVAPSAAQLIVEYFDNGSTFGPSTLQGVIHDAVKVGWSWYSRFPANAFFTLRQDSIHNSRLNPLLTHVRIWYYNPATGHRKVVFTGRVSEPDESGEDVVWTCWNYLAELSLSRTGYRTMYPNKLIGSQIAKPEWDLAQSADSSLLGHIVDGVFQDPLGSDGITPIKTDARFGVIDVPRLLLMFDLTEIGRANTANNVTMGITREAPFTFNFFKNAGSLISGQKLLFPGNVRDFRFVPGYASLRNDLATVGTSAAGGAVEIVKTDEANIDIYGRRQDVFTIKTLAGLAGAATELDAQTAITERAVKEATSLAKHLQLDMRPGVFEPFDGWDIEDRVVVNIRRGRTIINGTYRIVGARGLKDAHGYHPQLIVQLPTAA